MNYDHHVRCEMWYDGAVEVGLIQPIKLTILEKLIELNGDEIKGNYICYNCMVYWKKEAYK